MLTADRSSQNRRKLAKQLMDIRDGQGQFPDQSSSPSLYADLYQAATKTEQADIIMAAISEAGATNRQRHKQNIPRANGNRRLLRTVSLAAAAVVLMVFSSLVTARLITATNVVQVRFSLEAPEASSVGLAADFTKWSTHGYELARQKNSDLWIITVPLRKNRVYTYNFVIDGEHWIADPAAAFYLEDGLGGLTSFISL